jgi:hypothetical protein
MLIHENQYPALGLGLGFHRSMNGQEIEAAVWREVYGRVRVVKSDARDTVRLGINRSLVRRKPRLRLGVARLGCQQPMRTWLVYMILALLI